MLNVKLNNKAYFVTKKEIETHTFSMNLLFETLAYL